MEYSYYSSSQRDEPFPETFGQLLGKMRQLLRESLSLITRRRGSGSGRGLIIITLLGFTAFLQGRGAYSLSVFYFKKSFAWESADEFNTWFPKV